MKKITRQKTTKSKAKKEKPTLVTPLFPAAYFGFDLVSKAAGYSFEVDWDNYAVGLSGRQNLSDLKELISLLEHFIQIEKTNKVYQYSELDISDFELETYEPFESGMSQTAIVIDCSVYKNRYALFCTADTINFSTLNIDSCEDIEVVLVLECNHNRARIVRLSKLLQSKAVMTLAAQFEYVAYAPISDKQTLMEKVLYSDTEEVYLERLSRLEK
jgi:hypothetical protein